MLSAHFKQKRQVFSRSLQQIEKLLFSFACSSSDNVHVSRPPSIEIVYLYKISTENGKKQQQ